MGWLIALAVVTALALIPVGASIRYEKEQFSLKLRVGFLNFSLAKGKKEKKEEKQPEKDLETTQKAQKAQESQKPAEKKQKRPMKDYLPFLHLALDFLGSLRRKLRINKLYGKVILSGDDPCDLATGYGAAWAAVSNIMAYLNQIFVIEDQNVNVECDFTGEKTVYSGRVDLTLTVGRIVSLGLTYGIRAFKEFLIFKKRKGGAAL